ncbi:hypothetical protein [Streptomyces viridochromogenes]|uniref:hypothetical protein n=1 Tax=Streptomyces viridochromogenes TaxID=1938 RepID=UPI00131D9AEF|nr:hypothetical protein [Streptomyces viridochromogenes]
MTLAVPHVAVEVWSLYTNGPSATHVRPSLARQFTMALWRITADVPPVQRTFP